MTVGNSAGHDTEATPAFASAFLVPMPVIITATRSPPCSMMRAPEPSLDTPSGAANTRTGCASIFDAVEIGNRQSSIPLGCSQRLSRCGGSVLDCAEIGNRESAIINPCGRSAPARREVPLSVQVCVEVGSDPLDRWPLHLGTRKNVNQGHVQVFWNDWPHGSRVILRILPQNCHSSFALW
jgi:hypothetical protein